MKKKTGAANKGKSKKVQMAPFLRQMDCGLPIFRYF
jgi:hypothetical protein